MTAPPTDNARASAINVSDLFAYTRKHKKLDLQLVTQKHNLNRRLNKHVINRPGMNLFGFFKFFAYDRIQIFGKGEHAYLKELCAQGKLTYLEKLLSYPIPIIIFSHGNKPPPAFLKLAEKHNVPIATSKFPTLKLNYTIYDFFHESIIVKEVYYGVMMEIYGSGVLLQGPSGIGKSECALELLERGHRFVADDVINIKRLKDNTLIGYPSPLLVTHMEFNGIGIINVAHLFGVKSILPEKEIELIIAIEHYEAAKEYDLIGLESRVVTILDVEIPMVVLPVKAMSNIPILIETATMNQRLKKTGYNPAREFNKRVLNRIMHSKDKPAPAAPPNRP